LLLLAVVVGSLFIIGEILVGWAWWLVAHSPKVIAPTGGRASVAVRCHRGSGPNSLTQPSSTEQKRIAPTRESDGRIRDFTQLKTSSKLRTTAVGANRASQLDATRSGWLWRRVVHREAYKPHLLLDFSAQPSAVKPLAARAPANCDRLFVQRSRTSERLRQGQCGPLSGPQRTLRPTRPLRP
jgi:hypothetical protein